MHTALKGRDVVLEVMAPLHHQSLTNASVMAQKQADPETSLPHQSR